MFAVVPYFQYAYDCNGYEDWERNLEAFFSYFDLISNQKCLYAQRKLDEEPYWWWKDNYNFYRCWFVLQDLLCTRYAPHLFFTGSLRWHSKDSRRHGNKGWHRFGASNFFELKVDEPEPEVVDELESESEVEESLIETFADLLAEPIMEILFFCQLWCFLILEVAWRVRSFSDLSIGDKFIWDWYLGMWVNF